MSCNYVGSSKQDLEEGTISINKLTLTSENTLGGPSEPKIKGAGFPPEACGNDTYRVCAIIGC